LNSHPAAQSFDIVAANIPPPFRRLFTEARTHENAGREQIVVLIGALPSEMNVGYVEYEDEIVDTVDGLEVASLAHLVELLSGRDGRSHRIMLEDSECEIVLRHEDVDCRSQEILDRYPIPSDRSPDLMAMESPPSVETTATTATEPGQLDRLPKPLRVKLSRPREVARGVRSRPDRAGDREDPESPARDSGGGGGFRRLLAVARS